MPEMDGISGHSASANERLVDKAAPRRVRAPSWMERSTKGGIPIIALDRQRDGGDRQRWASMWG